MSTRPLLSLLVVAALSGCATPAAYESTPLPRFLVDSVQVPLPAARPESVAEAPGVRPALTLPDAIRECVLNSPTLKLSNEQVRLAQADYVTESLIPNWLLFADAQLLPIRPINIVDQGGPPQYDAYLTMPVDWLLFGKRVAAQAAARLNIDAVEAGYADQLRQEIALTVNSFYDALEADAVVRVTELALQALQELEQTARERGKGQDKAVSEARRVRLAVLDVQRELRRWRAAAQTTRAKLEARLGRVPGSSDFTVVGTLTVWKAAPLLTIEQAWELAEASRPDLSAARRAVVAADAAIEREQKRAYPQVNVLAGADYQDQVRITGFRNPWMWTVAVTSTLPFTDRNQGRILGAEANARRARAALDIAVRTARAEVEQALAEYGEALHGVTGEDVASLQAAREHRDETRAAYRQGDRDLLGALDAERAYRDRVRNTLSNLTDYWQALNHLNAAIGVRVLSAEEGDKEALRGEGPSP